METKGIDLSRALKSRDDFESKIILKSWQNEEFKKDLIANPKKVLAREVGQEVPANLDIEVVEETGNKVFFVLPRKPQAMTADGALSDEALQAVAGGVWFLAIAPTVEYDEDDNPVKFIGWRFIGVS
jgi:hypothetical protein